MTGFKNSNTISAGAWLKQVFFTKRMGSMPGLIVMALLGAGLAFAAVHFGILWPLAITTAVAALVFVMFCFYYPEFAYYSYFYCIILFTLPARLFSFELPLGVVIPATGYLSVLCVLSGQYRKRTDSAGFWKTPISLMMLVIFSFQLLEVFNPEIESRAGWWNFFQKQILYLLFYYVSFLMLDSLEKIRRFVKYWIILSIIVALWAVKQQFLGFTDFEEAYIHSDPNITNLLFQGGMFRKYSLLPDPAAFGIMSASSGLFTLVLAIRTPIKKYRIQLYLITLLLIIASTYSGTRTCNVMLVAGLLAYIIFTFNEKRTLILSFVSLCLAIFLLFGPTRNSPIISRMKTTLQGSKEPSNMVRDANRKNIQPYIYEHPMGGGLQTCGEEGRKFYPDHRLAGYPPDSGYMKIMLEQGWIGLAIHIIFYFFILHRGITGFYDCRKKEIKTLYMAFTVCFFSLIVGQYSQLGISQYPQYLFYLATLVIFYKLKEYDTKTTEENETVVA